MADFPRSTRVFGPEGEAVAAPPLAGAGSSAPQMAAVPASPAAAPPVCVEIEYGRRRLERAEASPLDGGRVVVLEQSGDEPVDVFVDGSLAGRGVLLLQEGRFCVRLTEVLADPPSSVSDAAGG